MKITALLVMTWRGDSDDPVILANASDVSKFGYFQRSGAKEFILFVGRTVAKRTPPAQRQSVQLQGCSFVFLSCSLSLLPISLDIVQILFVQNTKFIPTTEMASARWALWMTTTLCEVPFLFSTRYHFAPTSKSFQYLSAVDFITPKLCTLFIGFWPLSTESFRSANLSSDVS